MIVSGIARLFQGRIKADYVAGIWSHEILKGLAWQGRDGKTPFNDYSGPSWSWAGYDGITGLSSFHGSWRDVAQVEGWNAEPKDESNPYGQVKKGAWVKIHGPLARLRLSTTVTTEYEIRLQRAGITPLPRFCTPYSKNEEGTRMNMDHAEMKTSETLQQWDLQVICLLGLETKDDETSDVDKGATERPFDCIYGLVMRASESEEDGSKLERVGWMFMYGDEGHSIMEDETSWKSVTLI